MSTKEKIVLEEKPRSDAQWRIFEKQVARIEEFLAGKEATIKSPDTLRDKETGSKIKVDATIRQKVGSSEILIVIECRDRSRKQEIMWIRELIKRKEDTSASVMIGVSSLGFSAEAMRKAKRSGVLLRKLDKLDPEKILDYSLELERENYNTFDFNFSFYNDGNDPGFIFRDELLNKQENLGNEKFLIVAKTGSLISPIELFEYHLHQPNSKFFNNIKFSEYGVSPMIKMGNSYKRDELLIETSKGRISISKFTVRFKLIREIIRNLTNPMMQNYIDEDGEVLSTLTTFENISEGGKKETFEIHHTPDNKRTLFKADGFEYK